jgi:formylglycine-generating enzyme required for sulfatase activity
MAKDERKDPNPDAEERGAAAPEPSPKPSGPMATASDSATLAFGRPRPAAAPVRMTPEVQPSASDTRALPANLRRRSSSGGKWMLFLLILVVAGAAVFVVMNQNKDDGKQVQADETPPTAVIEHPADGLRTNASEVEVRGNVDDPKARVIVGNERVYLGEGGTFAVKVPLKHEGEQRIVIELRDDAGNSAPTMRLRVVRDTAPPSIEVLDPPPDAVPTTVAETVQIKGRVGDGAVAVTVAGEPVDLADDGTFTATTRLETDGEHAIAIVAKDDVGNEATATARVRRRVIVCCDTLRIDSPKDGLVTAAKEVEVRGTMEDLKARIVVMGKPVELREDGTFTALVPLEGEGERVIEVKASDDAGHEGTTTVRVVRDLTAPTLALTTPNPLANPKGAFLTSPGSMELGGTIKDSTPTTVEVNGVPAQVSGDTWKANVNISMGTPRIRIEAWDAAGNASKPVVREIEMPTPQLVGVTFKAKAKSGHLEYSLDADPTVILVLVPESAYRMGAVAGDEAAEDDEFPQHRVILPPVLISKTEITWAQYTKFAEATGRALPGGKSPEEYMLVHPVTSVTWADAQAYGAWAGGRLPTEAEWERAARGDVAGRVWPWGDEWVSSKATAEGSRGKTSPVASQDQGNGFGLTDVAGNAAEWCFDWYDPKFYESMNARDPKGPDSGERRVLRGGSWRDRPAACRLSQRESAPPDQANDGTGFRIAVTAKAR